MSSTIWKRRPSSFANWRQGGCSVAGSSAASSASVTAAEKRQPVLSLCTTSRSASGSIVSRYWPPIIPRVASASSRATSGVEYEQASRKASASSASPASTALPSPYAAQTLGLPRRSSSPPRDGRSSWTSEKLCTSSSASAEGI